MPVQVRVPTPLRGMTGNQAKVTASGRNVPLAVLDQDSGPEAPAQLAAYPAAD